MRRNFILKRTNVDDNVYNNKLAYNYYWKKGKRRRERLPLRKRRRMQAEVRSLIIIVVRSRWGWEGRRRKEDVLRALNGLPMLLIYIYSLQRDRDRGAKQIDLLTRR